ncbi:MAG: MFS transporter [Firmicutes bacterium]|nr:MFS transporter [Bacillota bacterium]
MKTTPTIWNRNFILLCICVFFASFTNFCFVYLLPVHILSIGGSNTTTGLMMTGLTLVGILTRVFFSPLIDRIGRKKVMFTGGLLYLANMILFVFFSQNLAAVVIIRIVCGFTQGLFFTPSATIVADVTPEGKLVDALGIFGVAGSLPAVFSSVVGNAIYTSFGAKGFFILTAAMAGLSVFVCALVKESYQPDESDSKVRTNVFRLDTILEFSILGLCVASLLVCFGYSAVNSFTITAGMARGIEGISWFFTINNIAMICTRLLTGRLTGKISENVLVRIGIVSCAAGIILIGFAENMAVMAIASVLTGIGTTLFTQLIQARVLSGVAPSRRGVASSTFALSQDGGAGFGSLAFGALSEAFGYVVMFVAAGAVCLPALLFGGRKKN